MYELANWIDKNITEISDSLLYKKFFSETELDNIDDDIFLENLDQGIDVIFTTKMDVSSIHLYSNKMAGSKGFKNELPFKLSFNNTRNELIKTLGEPNVTGGGYDDQIFGYIDLWDKYYLKEYSLHVKYANRGDSIKLITLGSLKFEETLDAD